MLRAVACSWVSVLQVAGLGLSREQLLANKGNYMCITARTAAGQLDTTNVVSSKCMYTVLGPSNFQIRGVQVPYAAACSCSKACAVLVEDVQRSQSGRANKACTAWLHGVAGHETVHDRA